MNSHFLNGFADELIKVAASAPKKESKDPISRAGRAVSDTGKRISKALNSPSFKRRISDYKLGQKAGHKSGRKSREYKLTAGDTARQLGSGLKDVGIGSAKVIGGTAEALGKGVYHGTKGIGKGLGAASEAVGRGAKKITESEAGRTGLGAAALALLARKMLKR